MTKKTLCIICGGQSAEHEVSLQSARNVVAAIDSNRFDTTLVGIGKEGDWHLYPPDAFLCNADDPQAICLAHPGPAVVLTSAGQSAQLVSLDGHSARIDIDVAFPVLHGTFGEDGTIQGLLKMAHVPYAGCDLASSANCMDKDIAKLLLEANGIRVAKAHVLSRPDLADWSPASAVADLGLPLFVKPARLGSSVGISKVENASDLAGAVAEAFRFDTKVLIEEGIVGREIEVAVLGNRSPEASLPGEVIPKGAFYSYTAKYVDDDGAVLIAPADMGEELTERVRQEAIRGFLALGCSGMARVDFFVTDKGEIVLNELNTIPGFTRISMYPRLWQVTGVTYPELVDRLVELAFERFAEESSLLTDYHSDH